MSELDYQQIYEDARDLLQQLVRNKCVNDGTKESGQEMRSVKTLISFFEKFGITEYEVFEPAPGRGNLLIKIPGVNNGAKSLMYQTHIDVVPVGQNWTEDPFGGEIKDDWLYGRGTLDMLIFAATQASAMAHLIQSGWRPKGDFYYLAVADEEAGGDWGAKWLVKNIPEKIKADYLISEFGGAILELPNGKKKSVVMNSEKAIGWTKLKITGIPGHASSPYKSINSNEIASEIIVNMKKQGPPTKITPPYLEFIGGLELNPLYNFLLTNKFLLNKIIPIIYKKEPLQASLIYGLTRMTVAPTILHGGTKTNIIPDETLMELDIRILPGQDESDIRSYIEKVIPKEHRDRVEIDTSSVEPTLADSWDDPIIDVIQDTSDKILPGYELTPLFMTGVTDARIFRKLGIKCYGYCMMGDGLPIDKMAKLPHGDDEGVPLQSIELSSHFFTDFAIDFYDKLS